MSTQAQQPKRLHNSKRMKIDFYLRFRTKFGESLAITGNIAPLGNNNGTQVQPLQFLNEELWHTSIEVEPSELPKLHYQF